MSCQSLERRRRHEAIDNDEQESVRGDRHGSRGFVAHECYVERREAVLAVASASASRSW